MTSQTITPIHAFSAGTHTTAAGHQVTISADDLQASAQAYNPELHEAPIVIGHPTGSSPAYGWIQSFTVSANDFIAQPAQVNPDFAELNNSGAFKKRSMSFYHPDNNQNPVPGIWYPRHLGFLGAQPPAVKGLRDFNFEEDAGDTVTIEFGEWTDRVEAGMWRNMREWILAKFGKDDADAAVPAWDVDLLQEEAAQPSKENAATSPESFSENTTTTNKEGKDMPEENKDTDFAEREDGLNQREANILAREQEAHRTSCADFVETLIDDGKVLAVHKSNLIEFMAGLEHVETIDFAEGDETVKQSPLAFIQSYFEAQPKIVSFGEYHSETPTPVDMQNASAIAQAATEFQESEKVAGRDVSITAAVNHVQKQNGGNTHE